MNAAPLEALDEKHKPKREGRHWACDSCVSGAFDTFITRATCPKCDKTWRETQCPTCHKMTPHVDWYVVDDVDES